MKLCLTKESTAVAWHLLTRCWNPKGRAETRLHAQLARGLKAGAMEPAHPETGSQPFKLAGELELAGPEALKALTEHLDKAIDSASFPGALSIGVDELLDAIQAAKEAKEAGVA